MAGISTSKIVNELREHLGVDDQELSEADALDLVNRSYWELENKIPFRERETTATFTTTSGSRNYAVPDQFDALRQLSILDPNSNKYTVLERDSTFHAEGERYTTSDAYGMPERYVREDGAIRLYPIPDQEYTITIKYWGLFTDLDISSTPNTPKVWHEILLYGAIWRGFLRVRDFQAVNQFKMQQLALINSSHPVESREEEDTHTAHLEVLGRDYP